MVMNCNLNPDRMFKEITALVPGSVRAQLLGLDRWLDPLVALDLPADVDVKAGVRRVRPVDCAQEVPF